MSLITTQRLTLRTFNEDDLDALHDLFSRPDVVRYLPWPVQTIEETKVALAKRIARIEPLKEGGTLSFAVVLTETGQLVGDFNLDYVNAELGRGEIGFVLHPDFGGHGYATEAGQAILRLAFETHDFHRVIGMCNAGNIASQRLMERLGMRQEAHFIQSDLLKGERVDVMIYAILKSDW